MHAWRARVGALGMVMLLAGCAADNASMNRTQGGVPDLRCDYGAPCGKTPGAPAEGSISR
ncbi:MAG TPA: hypothetical protein VL424_17070 [Pararobbsia sp.]|nr:hypothetical protein [Pararobbsia sp.]